MTVKVRALVAGVLFCALAGSGLAAEQAPVLRLTRKPGLAVVTQDGKEVLRVQLRQSKEGGDDAEMLGRCLLVRRNIRTGEIRQWVGRADLYTMSGARRTYTEHDLPVGRLMGNTFTSPSSAWTVIMDEDEGGLLVGFFHIGPACSLSWQPFDPTAPNDAPLQWGDGFGKARFVGDDRLVFPDLSPYTFARVSPGKGSHPTPEKVTVTIFADGRFMIEPPPR